MSYSYNQAGNLHCTLCPHLCEIPESGVGKCRVRGNSAGTLVLPYKGAVSALSMDPIEKKPLYHFFPGKQILSAGFYGCNFTCPFCQNFRISQQVPTGTPRLTPEELASRVEDSGSIGMAYTYSEPTIHFEFICETAEILKKRGLRNVLVTNGYLNRKPAKELLHLMDAVNVDLKSSDPNFYSDELGGSLEPVQSFIEEAANNCHVEVTTLVIEGRNSSVTKINSIVQFLRGINPDIPLHLSAYYPAYSYSVPGTNPSLIWKLVETSKKYLNFVYPGNIHAKSIDTHCINCGTTLVSRSGYQTSTRGFKQVDGSAVCVECGAKNPIIC